MRVIKKNNKSIYPYSPNIATLTLRKPLVDCWHIVVTDPRVVCSVDQKFEPLKK